MHTSFSLRYFHFVACFDKMFDKFFKYEHYIKYNVKFLPSFSICILRPNKLDVMASCEINCKQICQAITV